MILDHFRICWVLQKIHRNFSRITKPIREVITGLENQSERTAKKPTLS